MEIHDHYVPEVKYLFGKGKRGDAAVELTQEVIQLLPPVELHGTKVAISQDAEIQDHLHHTNTYVYHDHVHYMAGLEAGSVFWDDVPE